MAGTIDRATLDRLIALGRQRGELTAGELQAALPVEALDVDALVLVMLELEAAGVSVEPDALGPRAEVEAAGIRLPLHDPGTPTAADADVARGPPAAAPPPAPTAPPEAPDGRAGEEPVGRVVLLAGLAVLVVLGAILILV